MTTPTTISPERLLETLRQMLAGERNIAQLAKEAELPATVELTETRATALEQVIAILEVLTNPGLKALDYPHEGFPAVCEIHVTDGPATFFKAPTIMEAILKAHEAIQAHDPEGGATT